MKRIIHYKRNRHEKADRRVQLRHDRLKTRGIDVERNGENKEERLCSRSTSGSRRRDELPKIPKERDNINFTVLNLFYS